MDANEYIPGLDFYGDAVGPLPWPDGHFDLIVAVDVLEHISYRHTDRALTEWARVIRPGGKLYVQVPAADVVFEWHTTGNPKLCRWENDQPCTPLHGAQWRLLGGHGDNRYASEDDWRLNAHYSLWSERSLRDALEPLGFSCASVVNGHPNVLMDAVKK